MPNLLGTVGAVAMLAVLVVVWGSVEQGQMLSLVADGHIQGPTDDSVSALTTPVEQEPKWRDR